MSLTPKQIDQFNKIGQNFGTVTRRDLKAAATGNLAASVKNRNKKRDGVMEAVGFTFPRYGVFYEMGVFGGLTRKEAREQGKLDPHPWFNPTVDRNLPRLEKNMQELFEDFAVNAMRLRIKNTE